MPTQSHLTPSKIISVLHDRSQFRGYYLGLNKQIMKRFKVFAKVCFVIPSRYYTSLLFGLMVKFSRLVFNFFGPPVFIYLVVRSQKTGAQTLYYCLR